MSHVAGKLQAKSSTVSAVVTRANGQVEDLGVVSYYHRNPLRRLLWRVLRIKW